MPDTYYDGRPGATWVRLYRAPVDPPAAITAIVHRSADNPTPVDYVFLPSALADYVNRALAEGKTLEFVIREIETI
jgi:hypothetical protein